MFLVALISVGNDLFFQVAYYLRQVHSQLKFSNNEASVLELWEMHNTASFSLH